MFVCRLQFYHHVINVDLHASADLVSEDMVHKALIGGSCVLQTERHYFVAVVGLIDDECRLRYVGVVHRDLDVPGVGIQKT